MADAFAPSSLPFYDLKNKQAHRARYCQGAGGVFRQYVALNKLPPITTKTNAANTVTQVLLVALDNENSQIDITALLSFTYATESSNKWVVNAGATITTSTEVSPGNYLADPPTSEGEETYANWVSDHSTNGVGGFYLMLLLGGNWQYSDIFFIEDMVTGDPASPCGRVNLTWYDTTCGIGELRYDLIDAMRNSLWLASDVLVQEYQYTESGSEDGNREFYPVWQKVKKRLEIEITVPESIANSLALIPLHNEVEITDQYGDGYTVSGVEVPAPERENACLLRVKIQFHLDYVTKACC